LCLLVAALLPGCALMVVGAAGALGVAYVGGDLNARLDAAPAAIGQASVEAFEELDIRTISSASSQLDAQVIGRTATDRRVSVTAVAREEGGSALSIRVDTFGDQAMSRRILAELEQRLPTSDARESEVDEDR
jgi:hypothetical protein